MIRIGEILIVCQCWRYFGEVIRVIRAIIMKVCAIILAFLNISKLMVEIVYEDIIFFMVDFEEQIIIIFIIKNVIIVKLNGVFDGNGGNLIFEIFFRSVVLSDDVDHVNHV